MVKQRAAAVLNVIQGAELTVNEASACPAAAGSEGVNLEAFPLFPHICTVGKHQH